MNTSPGAASDRALSRARYIMIGGFLGAGKTTCMLRFARYLSGKGLKVGLITNDQGAELVDTALLRNHGFPTAEISGGCFCCRFESLTAAAGQLTQENRPDVILAEPVGSCTDLVATVSYPLRRIYGNDFSIAPLSVVVDPVRALRVLGVETGPRFSEKVLYIYRKQLEEADLIVINKIDSVEPGRIVRLKEALSAGFPSARVVEVSARSELNLEGWFESLLQDSGRRSRALSIDYETYAEGEALLGWLNASVQVGVVPVSGTFDGNRFLKDLADRILAILSPAGIEIAHCKMTFSPASGLGEIGVINLVRNDWVPELSQSLPEPVGAGEVIVNLRAEGDPDQLRGALHQALEQLEAGATGLRLKLSHLEFFRPGKPQPTHRMAESSN